MSAASLNLDRLGRYLEAHVPEFRELRSANKFPDGQSNPTFLLESASGKYVLRRKPPGTLLKSAHAVDREFRVLSALAGTGVPVARVYHLCEDEDVIGSVFYIMAFVDGRTFWDPALPELGNDERAAIYDQMNRTLAAIHSVDVDAVGLLDFGRPGNYFERQFSRWSGQYRASGTGTVTAMEQVMDWLGVNMVPDDGRACLVHGDYRQDNILFAPDEPVALAVLDWELSTLGHPFADLASQCAFLRMPPDAAIQGLAGVDRAGLGIPGEAAYVEAYCRRMNIEVIDNWTFYLVFSLFRTAAIAQGVRKRALDGNASSTRALEIGALVEPIAEMANALLATDDDNRTGSS